MKSANIDRKEDYGPRSPVLASSVSRPKRIHISDELYDWLRSLILASTDFRSDADINYYVSQNVRGSIWKRINEMYNSC